MLVERLPYECITGDLTFEEVSCGDRILKRSAPDGMTLPERDMDVGLAQTVFANPPNSERTLVINCYEGFAGIACLLSGSDRVTFVDFSIERINCVWKNVFANAPQRMSKVQCYTSEERWEDFDGEAINMLR